MDKKKQIRRAAGLAMHHKDQIDAMRRDLPKQIMYTEQELKKMLRDEATGVEFKEDAFWIGGVKMIKRQGNIWLWKNPYYDRGY